jgi:hypothetical protein
VPGGDFFAHDNAAYQTIGAVAGSKPPVAYFKTNKAECDPSLRNSDIARSNPGSRTQGAFHTFKRRQTRPLIDGSDIVGAQAGSLVTGIRVPSAIPARRTHPLMPDYQMPGFKESLDYLKSDPLGKEGCSMTAIGAPKPRPQTAVVRPPRPIALKKALDPTNENQPQNA